MINGPHLYLLVSRKPFLEVLLKPLLEDLLAKRGYFSEWGRKRKGRGWSTRGNAVARAKNRAGKSKKQSNYPLSTADLWEGVIRQWCGLCSQVSPTYLQAFVLFLSGCWADSRGSTAIGSHHICMKSALCDWRCYWYNSMLCYTTEVTVLVRSRNYNRFIEHALLSMMKGIPVHENLSQIIC